MAILVLINLSFYLDSFLHILFNLIVNPILNTVKISIKLMSLQWRIVMKGKKLSNKERIEKLEADATERRKIFKELCEHISGGFSLESFAPLGTDSIRKYLKVFKEEFVQEELDNAMRSGRSYWEDIGKRQANGECLGNSRTWFYNMANRFGWREKLEVEAEHKGQIAINVVSYASKKVLQDKESEQ